jgi:hypothetical protein
VVGEKVAYNLIWNVILLQMTNKKKTNVSILDSNNGQNKRIALKGDMTK